MSSRRQTVSVVIDDTSVLYTLFLVHTNDCSRYADTTQGKIFPATQHMHAFAKRKPHTRHTSLHGTHDTHHIHDPHDTHHIHDINDTHGTHHIHDTHDTRDIQDTYHIHDINYIHMCKNIHVPTETARWDGGLSLH